MSRRRPQVLDAAHSERAFGVWCGIAVGSFLLPVMLTSLAHRRNCTPALWQARVAHECYAVARSGSPR